MRNDFFRDHPDMVANLVRGIFEGMDMVRKDIPAAAQTLSKAFNIPVEDCQSMIGKDGGIADGDAHLTNYRENSNFFLDPMNPSNFEIVWNRASTIYKSLGAIDTTVPAAKVKAAQILVKMSEEYKDVHDLSQPTFRPGALFKNAEADASDILTKSVIIQFEPNKSVLNPDYDATIPATIEEIGKMAGTFGNAYIVIEGNTDASKKGIVPADLVRQLSYDRADSVRKSILSKIKFDPNKFKVVGNGWDNPVPGTTDSSNPDNNKKNRRVEVKVFPLEKEVMVLGFVIFAVVFVTVLTLVVRLGGLRVRLELPETKELGLTVWLPVGLILVSWWFCPPTAPLWRRGLFRPLFCRARWKYCRRFQNCTLNRDWCAVRLRPSSGSPLDSAWRRWSRCRWEFLWRPFRPVSAFFRPLALVGSYVPIVVFVPLTLAWFGLSARRRRWDFCSSAASWPCCRW